jgi:hypothetical protein
MVFPFIVFISASITFRDVFWNQNFGKLLDKSMVPVLEIEPTSSPKK